MQQFIFTANLKSKKLKNKQKKNFTIKQQRQLFMNKQQQLRIVCTFSGCTDIDKLEKNSHDFTGHEFVCSNQTCKFVYEEKTEFLGNANLGCH